jgi:hypothetical protein
MNSVFDIFFLSPLHVPEGEMRKSGEMHQKTTYRKREVLSTKETNKQTTAKQKRKTTKLKVN